MFAPLKLNVPALTFTNEPVPVPPSAIAPANVPLLNVNAVPSNVTNPVTPPSTVKAQQKAIQKADTLIEALGGRLTAAGHRVAVLAVDPSSARSGGSRSPCAARIACVS